MPAAASTLVHVAVGLFAIFATGEFRQPLAPAATIIELTIAPMPAGAALAPPAEPEIAANRDEAAPSTQGEAVDRRARATLVTNEDKAEAPPPSLGTDHDRRAARTDSPPAPTSMTVPEMLGDAMPTALAQAPSPEVPPKPVAAPIRKRSAPATKPSPPQPTETSAVPVTRESAARETALGAPRAAPEPTMAMAPAIEPMVEPAYARTLLAWLERHKDYPRLARQRGIEGRAVIRLTLARDGHVVAAVIAASSGQDVLDRATLAMVKRANPMPPLPAGLLGDHVEFLVPVVFALGRS